MCASACRVYQKISLGIILGMPKAFDRLDDAIPTVRWIGEVHTVTDEHFSGLLYDDFVHGDVKAVVEIPFRTIVETERARAVPSILFYCDVELGENESFRNIRAIEFDDELTDTQHKAAGALLLGVLAKDKERWGD
jgi:hypothetical protein